MIEAILLKKAETASAYPAPAGKLLLAGKTGTLTSSLPKSPLSVRLHLSPALKMLLR
jgi:hypothetical protein